jgi:hypothetical protein
VQQGRQERQLNLAAVGESEPASVPHAERDADRRPEPKRS